MQEIGKKNLLSTHTENYWFLKATSGMNSDNGSPNQNVFRQIIRLSVKWCTHAKHMRAGWNACSLKARNEVYQNLHNIFNSVHVPII